MYIKNLILLISLFFIFNCSKNIREIEKGWKKSCINEYKHTEGSFDYKNCMIIQEENFLEKHCFQRGFGFSFFKIYL